MKKIAYLASAVLAGLGFSTAAKADVSASGSFGATIIEGSATTTEFMTGGGVSGSVTLNVVGGTGITANANDIAIDSTVATLTGSQTLTNKTLTSPVLNTGVSGTAILDEDNMASDSATQLATQQSIKAYVDSQVASKDNTDEITEGSTNLYYTDARVQAISINNLSEDTTPQLGGNLDINGHNILYADNEKAIFGDGPDLEIYHDGTDSYITDVGDGSIKIRSGTTYITNAAGSKVSIQTNSGAGQLIYFNNALRLETVDGGAKVTGNLEVTGNFVTATTDNLTEGSTNLYHTNARVDARITKAAIDALNVDADTLDSLDSTAFLRADANDSHTGDITPGSDNAVDLGTSSLRYAEIHAVSFKGTATSAQYADLAEKYVSDKEYEVGTVCVFGGSEEVTQSTKQNCPSIAGVVSTDPAFLMNEGLEGGIVLALRGRVPVKVTGPVRKGDVLICSNTPGHAEAAPFKGYHVTGPSMIGVAISEHLSSGTGVVEAQIK